MFLFEHGMRALQQHDYQGASRQFTVIVEEFPIADGLADRARVYLDLCNRELDHRPDAGPASVEEQLTAATAALNDDEDVRACELARSVLNVAPDHDLALYIMAAVHARRGSLEAALDFLRRAIAASPDVGAQVRHDEDFECLRGSMDFQALLEEAVARPQEPPKTYRKARSER
jgi:Tfp pilus assembly protein PilF